jgi:hypothetical protein
MTEDEKIFLPSSIDEEIEMAQQQYSCNYSRYEAQNSSSLSYYINDRE